MDILIKYSFCYIKKLIEEKIYEIGLKNLHIADIFLAEYFDTEVEDIRNKFDTGSYKDFMQKFAVIKLFILDFNIKNSKKLKFNPSMHLKSMKKLDLIFLNHSI